MNPAFVNKNDLSFSNYMTYDKYGKHPEQKYMDAFAPGNNVSSVQTSRTDVESDLRGVTRKISACESIKNSFIKSEGSSSINIPAQHGRAAKKIKLDKKDLKIGENHVRCTCETCLNLKLLPKPKISTFKPKSFN
jgi:hypothetical protein